MTPPSYDGPLVMMAPCYDGHLMITIPLLSQPPRYHAHLIILLLIWPDFCDPLVIRFTRFLCS